MKVDIDFVSVNEEEQKLVDQAILSVMQGRLNVEIDSSLQQVVGGGVDGVIIGCSELSLISNKISSVPVLDSLAVSLEKAWGDIKGASYACL